MQLSVSFLSEAEQLRKRLNAVRPVDESLGGKDAARKHGSFPLITAPNSPCRRKNVPFESMVQRPA